MSKDASKSVRRSAARPPAGRAGKRAPVGPPGAAASGGVAAHGTPWDSVGLEPGAKQRAPAKPPARPDAKRPVVDPGEESLARGVSLSEHPIRMICIDLDGTLLNSSKQVSDQTLRALRGLPQDDLRIVIASARPPRSVRHIYHALGLDTLTINYNGALIWDEPKRKPVYHRPMDPYLVRRIVDLARELFDEVLVSCEVLDRWFTDREDQTYTTETGRLFKPDVIAPLDEFCNQPVTKLMLLAAPDTLRKLAPVLRERFARDVSILHADEDLLQIMDKRVGKAAAVKRVAKRYGVKLEEVMAIGDAPNDVGMLQLAGVAVAMDNAHPLVKQVADWIAPSNDDHGVHAALVRYGVCAPDDPRGDVHA